ncbi:MAG: Gfo/Idh/MocA family oxidoreductase [Planctomycetia bacterium]|nr:Gfo/Idh/MocA family oxidoreductase [Planctomycetia bacterium]
MKKKLSRRDFFKTSTIAGTGFLVASGNFAKQSRASALQDVAVAGVGVGGKGSSDIKDASYYGKVVAICDVDKNTLEGQSQNFKDAKKYVDFREMFAEMGDKIDACTVSTTDHMHTVISAMAMKAGKHVYTQKPLTRTIGEARYLGNLAKSSGVCTQMGNQGSVEDGLRKLSAQFRSGVLGNIKEVHVWTNRPIWPQGPNRAMTLAKFSEEIKKNDPDIAADEIAEKEKQIESALSVVDWKLWLGTAPYREFWPGVYHSFSWRGWWDFGTGALGDMACHNVNMPFKGCELKNPTSVVAISSGHDFDSFPASSTTVFEFPANDWRGPVKFVWYDAAQMPPIDLTSKYGFEKVDGGGGSFIIGEKGAALNGTFKEEGGKEIPWLKEEETDFVIAPIDEQGRGGDSRHKFEWFNAIWQNKPEICWSNFPNHAGPLTETILLGNLAIWAAPEADKWGEKIEWDAEKLIVTNLDSLKTPGVAQLVRPIYQEGYENIDI